MRDSKNIDRLFQENLKDFEVLPPNKSWNAIEKKLAPISKKRRIPIWFKLMSIAALLILFFSVGSIYFLPKNNFTKNLLKNNFNSQDVEKELDTVKTIVDESVKNDISKGKLNGKVIQLNNVKKDVIINAKSTVIVNLSINNTGKSIEFSEKKLLKDAKKIPLVAFEENPIVKKNNSSGKLTVATIFAPIYINSFGDGSGVDSQFSDSPISGNSSYSYGVKFAYQLNNKFSVQSGINLISLGYTTSNIYVSSGVAIVGVSNLSTSPVLAKPSRNSTLKGKDLNSNKGSLNQVFGYVEIPVEVKYNITNGKLGVNLVGGFSTLLLNKDEVFVETNDFIQSLGASNNLRSINFSGNIGVDVDYSIKKNLYINISPMFKVQTNTFSKNDGSVQPYYLGVYTGLNYTF